MWWKILKTAVIDLEIGFRECLGDVVINRDFVEFFAILVTSRNEVSIFFPIKRNLYLFEYACQLCH